MTTGDLNGAAEAFDKVKSTPLDPAEGYNNSGVLLLKSSEPEKASSEIDRAIKVQRNNQAAWNNRGCVVFKVDRVREAMACFEESAVMGASTVALSNKGFCQLTLDSLQDALHSFDQSLKAGETPEAYNNKGIVLERMGKRDLAQTAYKEALRLAPKFKDAQDNARRVGLEIPVPPKPVAEKPSTSPPKEEVVGLKETASASLSKETEQSLKEKRKPELEAMCESLGIDSRGTKVDLIERLLKAKGSGKK